MIPTFNTSGVLPPFLPGGNPTQPAAMAPYRTSIVELAKDFSGTAERLAILSGLLDFRESLRNLGINSGFQWVGGSFMEDCETNRGRAPNDVDIVTFAHRPKKHAKSADWVKFMHANIGVFTPSIVKKNHSCDAYYVDLMLAPEYIVSQSRYWFGLFSHQRSTHLWKGMVELPLIDNDTKARGIIAAGVSNAP